LADAIHIALDPGDATVTNGPVFRDYDTRADGGTLEAEYMAKMGQQVLLKTSSGRQRKMTLSDLSEEDRLYVELENPPAYNIAFLKTSKQIPPLEPTPFLNQAQRPQRIFDYVFGVGIEPSGKADYPHELRIEYFAVAEEVDGDNYILLQHGESSFTPDPENRGAHEFHGEKVRVESSAIRESAPMRGAKYGGYLVVITDSRGSIIQHKTSSEWLFEHLDNLRRVPEGKHFNRECVRVGPPRPTRDDRPGWTFR
jgi:hypothetical protein